ncbi:MAG: AAA family ATPase [Terrimicrobiaceae bacterium]
MTLLDAIRISTKPAGGIAELGLPPRAPLLADWFKEGDTGFLFAPRGLGKTWLSMGLACAVANGSALGPWHAHKARKVVYVDGEMAVDGMLDRLAGMGSGENLSILNHEVLFHLGGKTLNVADADTQRALTGYVLESGAALIVLDNLSCLCSGQEENNADAWEPILHWLLILRRHKVAVLIVHHAGRNGQMRGTSRREDAAFWVLRLDAAEDAEGIAGRRATFLSRFTKERNSGKEQAPLQWTFETGTDGIVRVGHKEASGLSVFRQWIEDGLDTASDIATEMGVSKGTISKMAKRAQDAGWLTTAGRRYKLVS